MRLGAYRRRARSRPPPPGYPLPPKGVRARCFSAGLGVSLYYRDVATGILKRHGFEIRMGRCCIESRIRGFRSLRSPGLDCVGLYYWFNIGDIQKSYHKVPGRRVYRLWCAPPLSSYDACRRPFGNRQYPRPIFSFCPIRVPVNVRSVLKFPRRWPISKTWNAIITKKGKSAVSKRLLPTICSRSSGARYPSPPFNLPPLLHPILQLNQIQVVS